MPGCQAVRTQRAAFSPCSLNGVTLTIRKFRPHWFTIAQLVESGMLTVELAADLADAVRARKNILIASGTNTGKTTLAKALIEFVPLNERPGFIEDTAELKFRSTIRISFALKRKGRRLMHHPGPYRIFRMRPSQRSFFRLLNGQGCRLCSAIWLASAKELAIRMDGT